MPLQAGYFYGLEIFGLSGAFKVTAQGLGAKGYKLIRLAQDKSIPHDNQKPRKQKKKNSTWDGKLSCYSLLYDHLGLQVTLASGKEVETTISPGSSVSELRQQVAEKLDQHPKCLGVWIGLGLGLVDFGGFECS